jgi:hypothetical protein
MTYVAYVLPLATGKPEDPIFKARSPQAGALAPDAFALQLHLPCFPSIATAKSGLNRRRL